MKSIGEINEVLRVIPQAYLLNEAIGRMGAGNKEWSLHGIGNAPKSLYSAGLKQWKVDVINGVIHTLMRIKYIKGKRLDPTAQIHDAAAAITKLEHNYADLLERKFEKDPLLASYIKCHVREDSATSTDRFTMTMRSILEKYPDSYPAEQVCDDIGEGLLNLIIKTFNGKLDLKMFADSIDIHLGFRQPLPICVTPMGDFSSITKKVSQEDIESMFMKYDVIYLPKR